MSPDAVYACQKQNGKVRPGNFRGDEYCRRPLPDGDRQCSDKSDCIGNCVVKGPPAQNGDPVTGTCEAFNERDIGQAVVIKGRYVQLPIAD